MTLLGRLALLLACLMLTIAGPASALDPARTISQYKHTRWTIDDGVPPGILSLAQGHDGYLWVGTQNGLFRFDGVAFEPIPPQHVLRDRANVTALLGARDGTVWAGYAAGGIARYGGGVLRDMGAPVPNAYVVRLVETADGSVWALFGEGDRQLARYAHGRWETVDARWGLGSALVIHILAARDGSLWVSAKNGIFSLEPGSRHFERSGPVPTGHGSLSQDSAGRIWLSDDTGSRSIAPGTPGSPIAYPTPASPRATHSFFDRDGNLWSITGRDGLHRVRAPNPNGESSLATAAAKVEGYGQKDGLTGDDAGTAIEDGEGNIWVGTSLGLDRLRAANVVAEPLLTNLPAWGFVLLSASDGSVYIGTADTVYRARPGGAPVPVLDRAGEAEAMCEGRDGAVWMITQHRISRFHDGRITTIPHPRSRQSITDCAVDRHNILWLTADEGLFRRTATGWRLFPAPPNDAMPITALRDGRLLVSYPPRALRRIDFPYHADITLKQPDRLRRLRTIYEGSGGVLLGGGFGLARLQEGRVQFLDPIRMPAFSSIVGIVQTPRGETWMFGKAGIIHLPTATLNRLFDAPTLPVQPSILDFRDGLAAGLHRDGKRDAVRGGDGRIWFSTLAGVVWVDAEHLVRNTTAPHVAVTGLKTNRATYRDPVGVTLPMGTSMAEIDFTALSLAIPERVRFRYMLEGVNTGWMDPGQRRQAFYTNLGPGTYRFRVIASNNDGVWNREGATLDFTIPPTFLQSIWFKLLCLIGAGALMWLAYSIRLHQVSASLHARLEVRLAERERIARELHDTLLQGFQGLILRFQAVAERIAPDQPLRPIVDDALDRAEAVLVEGRNRVHELRVPATQNDLAQAMLDAAGEFSDRSVRFALVVEGRTRALHPMVCEEVQRIGEEAIRNAFHHARASVIELALSYRARELRLLLRDNGTGMPADILATGERAGHFGLIGMRERAQRIGGTLTISSGQDAGTEILLSIPARAAYVERGGRWRFLHLLQRRTAVGKD